MRLYAPGTGIKCEQVQSLFTAPSMRQGVIALGISHNHLCGVCGIAEDGTRYFPLFREFNCMQVLMMILFIIVMSGE